MFELAWKVVEPNGNQPIKLKSFRTEERRQDFIDTMFQSRPGFQLVSKSMIGSHTIQDFEKHMRVKIIHASHPDRIGRRGTVIRTSKRSQLVMLQLENGDYYGSFPWNLEIV